MIMRKDVVQDKMADVDIITVPAERCPQCGEPMSRYSCRFVELGQWCRQYGLKQDPRTIIGQPTPDPRRQIVEQTKEVKAAVAEVESKTAAADEAKLAFDAAAQARIDAFALRSNMSRTVMDFGEVTIYEPPGTPSLAEVNQLQAAQEQAKAMWEHAAEQAIRAQQALDKVRRRAMQRLPAGV
jgi:hypothetical protein